MQHWKLEGSVFKKFREVVFNFTQTKMQSDMKRRHISLLSWTLAWEAVTEHAEHAEPKQGEKWREPNWTEAKGIFGRIAKKILAWEMGSKPWEQSSSAREEPLGGIFKETDENAQLFDRLAL